MADPSAPGQLLDSLQTVLQHLKDQGYPDMGTARWASLQSWLLAQLPAPGTPSETVEAQARHQVLGEVLLVMQTMEAAGG